MPTAPERAPSRLTGRAATAARTVAWTMLGGVVASSLGLPWSLAAGVFFAVAAVAAVVALTGTVGAHSTHRTAVVVLGVSLALSVVMLLSVLGQLLFYRQIDEYQRCLRTALTESGQERCEELAPGPADLLRGGR